MTATFQVGRTFTTHRHVHVDTDDDAPWTECFETSSALTLALLLTDRQRPPGGVCAAHGRERVFVDCGSARRYCSTRARVAAHRRAATFKEGRVSR